MEPSERKHVQVDIVDGTAIVRFVNTDIIFAEGIVQEMGNELLRLVEDQGFNQIVLDLSGVRYLSSTMLGKLVSLSRRIEQSGGRLRLCCLSPVVSDILRISRLDRVFEIFDDIPGALVHRHAAPVEGSASGPGADPGPAQP